MDLLLRKAISGMIGLFIVMCLVLFLPALTIYYWQAWAFLASFFIPTTLITVYLAKHDRKLLERRSSAGPGVEKESKQKIIQSAAQISFIGMMLLPALDHHYRWSDVSVWLVVVSDLLIIGSFYIIHLVFRENSHASAIIEVEEDQTVISTGPYGIIRHPMYAGAMPLVIFAPLALGSYWGLIFSAGLVFVIILRLLSEERYLKDKLVGYSEYCKKVTHRLIPFVW